MGSAALKYGADGRVAWDQIWESFCDLAMAGGPPHKGALLEPGSPAEIEAQPDRYQEVTDEICRGVSMVTDLQAVRLTCARMGAGAVLQRHHGGLVAPCDHDGERRRSTDRRC